MTKEIAARIVVLLIALTIMGVFVYTIAKSINNLANTMSITLPEH